MSFLKLTSVEKTEADKKILDNINWEINGNENWIVFGPNGSGSSWDSETSSSIASMEQWDANYCSRSRFAPAYYVSKKTNQEIG